MERIYLDNAATTPLSACAAQAMAPYLQAGVQAPFGNANSVHSVGREAFAALEDARMRTSRALGASRPDEVIFTSGATEADNAALLGMALGQRERRRLKGSAGGHVVISRVEHDAVLQCASALKRLGFEVSFAENDAAGRVSPDSLEAAMRDDTVLVSIMAVNNEVGTVMDTAALAAVAHKHGALFHVDAVQALGKIAFDVRALGVDAASFSAHKVGGPKGVGVLYLKTRTPLSPCSWAAARNGACAAAPRTSRASWDAPPRWSMPCASRPRSRSARAHGATNSMRSSVCIRPCARRSTSPRATRRSPRTS